MEKVNLREKFHIAGYHIPIQRLNKPCSSPKFKPYAMDITKIPEIHGAAVPIE